MIQRIQSVLLLSTALLGIIFSFTPIIEYEYQGKEYVMKAYNTLLTEDVSIVFKNMGIGFIGGIIIVIALVTIFLYKKRQLQIKLAKLNILLIALQVAAVVFYSEAAVKVIGFGDIENVIINFKYGAIFPVLSLILTYLTVRFIKKDENLLKAADRLR